MDRLEKSAKIVWEQQWMRWNYKNSPLNSVVNLHDYTV